MKHVLSTCIPLVIIMHEIFLTPVTVTGIPGIYINKTI